MRRRFRFFAAVVGWLLLIIVAMALADRPQMDFLIVGGTLGLLTLSELTTPASIQPEWQRRLWFVRVAAVVLTILVLLPRVSILVGS